MFMQGSMILDKEASVYVCQKLMAAEVWFHAAAFLFLYYATDYATGYATDGCNIKKSLKKLASSGSAPYNTELLRAEGSDANDVR